MRYIPDKTIKLLVVCAVSTLIIFTGFSPAVSAPPDPEMCAFLEQFHGHTCPGSLMGLRLGLAAKEALNAKGKITAKTFLHACPADGIQIATGTTIGNKTFTLEDRGEMYLVLTDSASGKQVEARLTEKAGTMGKQFRDLSGKSRSLAAGSPERLSLEKEIEAVLDWFRTAPDSEVVTTNIKNN